VGNAVFKCIFYTYAFLYGLYDHSLYIQIDFLIPLPLHLILPPWPGWHWGLSSLLFYGYQKLFPQGIKQPEHETDHSPPSGTEVKNV
jgi:hypothetical protein